MRTGTDAPPEVKARALALYAETHSSYKAEAILQAEMDDAPVARSIQRWAETEEGFIAKLSQERKLRLADNWYGIALDGTERVALAIKELPLNQVTVPAAIATDKYLKLTEETPQGSAPSVTVFVGVKVEP